jgi:hypothetical protein
MLSIKKNTNERALPNTLPEDIYRIFFEKAFPNSPLKFEGLKASEIYPHSASLVFSINGEEIS